MAKFCPSCGTPLTGTGKFCEQCGTPIPQSAAPAPTPEPQPAPAQPAPQPTPEPVPVPPPAPQPVQQPTDQPTLPNAATYPPPPVYPTAGAPGAYVTPPKKSKTGLLIVIIAAVLVVLGVLAFFGFRDGGFLRGVGGTTESFGYYEVLVPDGYRLDSENYFGEKDPGYFALNKKDNFYTYFMFNMMDEESAKDSVQSTRYANDGAEEISCEYDGKVWRGVAYKSYHLDCFVMYAKFSGHYVLATSSGHGVDDAITKAVLSSLHVSAKADRRTNTTTKATTTATKATTTTTTTTAATATTTTAAPAPTADINAVAGAYPFTGEYSEYFGETVVDEGTVSGTFRFAVSGSELEATLLADGGNETSFPMSYDPDTMTATYSYESESEVESIVVTFYEAGGNMCMAAVMQFDYPYSDIPSDTYYLNGARE